MILYRPVGTKELGLIKESGYIKYPPRLPEQPIFYPVLKEKYAIEIAAQWNVKYNDDYKGYVTKYDKEHENDLAFAEVIRYNRANLERVEENKIRQPSVHRTDDRQRAGLSGEKKKFNENIIGI